MPLNVFSIAGEALNFGWRRFETILRVGWLPVSLLLVFNMAAVFLWLSLAYGKPVSFADVAASGARWADVIAIAQAKANEGLAANSTAAWLLQGATLAVNAVLIASFMAPLIRYAGLGEKPAPGLLRAPFGADQVRFLAAGALSSLVFAAVVYAPITLASMAALDFMATAMTTPFASFPDADSLHTMDVIFGADRFGVRWLYGWQVWGAATALLAGVLFVGLFAQVAPRRDDRRAGIGVLGRALGVALGVIAFFGAAAVIYALFTGSLAAAGLTATARADGLAGVLFVVAAIGLAALIGLRLYPYAGVATCRRSMALAGSLRVTRRFNLLRLLAAFLVVGAVLFGAQILLAFAAGQINSALVGIVMAAQSAARLGGGDEASALRLAIWLWAAGSVVATALWALFSYGVTAGLMGRLYRESERVGLHPEERAL